MVKLLAIGSILVTFVTNQAVAQDMDALKSCAAIDKDKQRLACYDQVMLKSLMKSNPEIFIKKEEEKKENFGLAKKTEPVTRENFGNPPKPKKQKKKKEPKVENAIMVSVISAKKNRTGKYIFTTSDGQVWRQTDSFSRPLSRKGFEAKIKRTGTGSYILSPASGKWSVRVKRTK